MQTLRNILERRERSAAENVNARFVAELGGGWCSVTLRDTGAMVRAKRATPLPIGVGQDVIVSKPDGSGRSRNTGYTIIALASVQLDTSAPVVQRTSHVAASITSITPDPAIIAAGDVVAITIRGIGFSMVPSFEIAPAYGDAGLSNSTPPVITDTQIALAVVADAALTPGDYSLAIGTLRTENSYFQVAAGSFPAHSLWAMIYDASFNPVLLRIVPSDMSTFASYDLFTGGDFAVLDAVKIGDAVFARSDHTMFRVADPGGSISGTPSLLNGQGSKFGTWGTKLVYGVYDGIFMPALSMFETADLSETATGYSPSSGIPATCVTIDGDEAFFVDSFYVIRFDLVGLIVLDSLSYGADPVCVAVDPTYLYVGSSSGLAKLTRSPLAVVDSSPAGTIGAFSDSNELQIVAGFLYATNQANQFLRIDTSDLSFTAVSIPDGPRGFAYSGDDGIFYVGDVAGGITAVDIATFSNQGRTVVTTNDVRRLLYT